MKKKSQSSKSAKTKEPATAPDGATATHFFQKQLSGEEPLTWATAERLYGLAVAIFALKPWDFLADGDPLLLRDPKSGEMCYCSVMGALGEVVSLQVYVGPDSYRFFRRLSSGAAVTPAEFLANFTGVSVEFVRLSELTPPDREFLKCFGHPMPRGSGGPIFRALRPGFHPWYVTESEGFLLAECMQALIAFCAGFLENPDVSYWDGEDVYPLSVPIGGEGLDREYKVESVKAPVPPPSVPKPPVLDEARLRRVREKDYPVRGKFEADSCFVLAEIGEKNQRKSCARLGLVTDAGSGIVFPPALRGSAEPAGETLVEALLNAIDAIHSLPAEVLVDKAESKVLLDPLARHLGFAVRVVKSLPSLERARDSVLGMMGGR
jgi:hypothetical protein